MSEPGKKCHNLVSDRNGGYYCKSTHVCYKSTCYSSIFETVTHQNGHIITTSA